jgi:DNA damage-binding protein 1
MDDNLIVAALTKTVVVGKYVEESSTSGKLHKMASYRPSTYPVDLAVEGNIIAIADLMKSISLIEFIPGTDGNAAMMTERARHYQSAWATAVCHVEGQSWLETDAQGNLMVLRRNPDGPTLEDQRRMEMTSEMNLGEMVNSVRKVSVETMPSAMIAPKAFIGTVSHYSPSPCVGPKNA